MKYLLLLIFVFPLAFLTACNNNPEAAEESSSNEVKTEIADAEVNKDQDRKIPPIYYSPFDIRYPGGGFFALVDGELGSTDFNDGRWQGYSDRKLDVAIDLGKETEIKSISANFLLNIEGWTFLPESFAIFSSSDMEHYIPLGELISEIPTAMQEVSIETLRFDNLNVTARYIRFKANSIGSVPDWYKPAKGGPAWFFIDEIVIE